jgi:hypothetical protein
MRVLRGRPKLENQTQLVSVSDSLKVIDYFRASWPGCQARMDAVFKYYVKAHSTGDAKGAYHQDEDYGGGGNCHLSSSCPLLILGGGPYQ